MSEIKTLLLNSLPTDYDFEDYISAQLLLGGYTLDRSIHEKVAGAGEIFEVDVITHQYNNNDEKCLLEIKSKGWDMNELFKTGGRLLYLGIPTGAFVIQDKIDEKKYDGRKSASKKMNISMVYAGKTNPTDSELDMTELYSVFGINAGCIDKAMLASIRFSYNAERCMKNRVSQLKKSQNKEGLAALWDYSNAIQDISFEDGNPLNRLLRTFDLFKNYYHISARLDYEKLHGSFPDNEKCTAFESGRIKGYMLNEIDYVPVNYAMFLEHRLRLYILQSCVEYLVMPQQQYKNEIDEFLRKISYYSLTGNITTGIEYLNQKCPNFRLYPRLWQLFTYMMGGFLLTDLMDKEIQLLSNLSGVPYGEVMHALNVYDILFPIANNWIRPINNTHIQRLNMMPAPLMGIGANLRRIIYRDDDTEEGSSYDALQKKLSSDYTFDNLLKWHQAGFNLLKNSMDLIKN